MTIDAGTAHSAFLAGGGQLGALIAAFDWSTTPLGPISGWCSTLKISVSIALRSQVPIVMLWGADGIMIYNDAYAVFAGNRHPHLLGSRVRQGWPEVAAFNDHVMHTVLAGGTLAFTNQELTLERNGTPEPAWMNLDYSPIVDETGQPVAVIAIVVETTSAVKARRWLAGERDRMRQMFEQAPGFMAMLEGPDHVFALTNAAYMQLVGHRDVIGKPVRQALPEIEGQGFFELLDSVYSKGQPFIGQALIAWIQRTPDATAEQRFLDLVYQPVRNPDGDVIGIFVEGADVTERVLAEQVVRDSEAQFRLYAETLPNHVWTSQPDGVLDWFNSRVYQYSGVSPGDLDNGNWITMVHPDDLDAARRAWATALDTGEPYEIEFRLRRHDGQYRWHIGRAVAIPIKNERILRWIGTNTDIDDQKRIVQALAESETRLRLAIDAGQSAIWDLDLVGSYITPSAALNRLYGFADDASPTLADYQSRYAPGERERIGRLGQASLARGHTDVEAEVLHIWPDGTQKTLLIRAQIVDGGQRALGVVIDITERKRVEARLMESERRFRLSQKAAGIASLELDIATGTVVGSDHFWEIWGLSQRESVDISVLEEIVVPTDRDIRSTSATRKAGTAEPAVEYRIVRPDTGELRWLSRHIEFLYDHQGQPLKMFGVMQDITERKEAQSRQELLTHELEHRIKNILAMVSAIASQTLRNTDLATASANFIDRLHALANAHDVLNRTRWTEASLEEVVRSAVSALPAERLQIGGPEIALNPKMALSLALSINELGTNSLKYGSLSQETGRVEVQWRIEPAATPGAQCLRWSWTESGGPPVTPPSRRGFGRFLIERVLAADFQGEVILDYAPAGVVCTLVAPLPQPSQR